MSKGQRIRRFIAGFVEIPLAIVMMLIPKLGYPLILIALSLGLTLRGARDLFYYFTLARHMVGGRRSFYTGILIFDLGLFTASLTTIPHIYILLYLIGIHAFGGLVGVLAALEEKRHGAAHWRLKLSGGIVNIFIALLCVIFIKSENTAIYIYCLGMIYSGVMRMVMACRKTAMVCIR
ncbi:MAG: hypothetical protein IIZ61_07740 [Lachnospiraceae bacterium]|nr:hypothetical protein [Lachnospiraceae bacterium]